MKNMAAAAGFPENSADTAIKVMNKWYLSPWFISLF